MAHRRPSKGMLRLSLAHTIMCERRDYDYFSVPAQLSVFPGFNNCVDFSSVLFPQTCACPHSSPIVRDVEGMGQWL